MNNIEIVIRYRHGIESYQVNDIEVVTDAAQVRELLMQRLRQQEREWQEQEMEEQDKRERELEALDQE